MRQSPSTGGGARSSQARIHPECTVAQGYFAAEESAIVKKSSLSTALALTCCVTYSQPKGSIGCCHFWFAPVYLYCMSAENFGSTPGLYLANNNWLEVIRGLCLQSKSQVGLATQKRGRSLRRFQWPSEQCSHGCRGQHSNTFGWQRSQQLETCLGIRMAQAVGRERVDQFVVMAS